MIKIKFNGYSKFHICNFSRISDHVVTLGGCKVESTSGFGTYRMSGEQLGDFSDYNTIYRVLDDTVQYSNDGSVYVERTAEEMDTDYAEIPPTPSQLDRVAAQALYTALMTDTLLEEGSDDV